MAHHPCPLASYGPAMNHSSFLKPRSPRKEWLKCQFKQLYSAASVDYHSRQMTSHEMEKFLIGIDFTEIVFLSVLVPENKGSNSKSRQKQHSALSVF